MYTTSLSGQTGADPMSIQLQSVTVEQSDVDEMRDSFFPPGQDWFAETNLWAPYDNEALWVQEMTERFHALKDGVIPELVSAANPLNQAPVTNDEEPDFLEQALNDQSSDSKANILVNKPHSMVQKPRLQRATTMYAMAPPHPLGSMVTSHSVKNGMALSLPWGGNTVTSIPSPPAKKLDCAMSHSVVNTSSGTGLCHQNTRNINTKFQRSHTVLNPLTKPVTNNSAPTLLKRSQSAVDGLTQYPSGIKRQRTWQATQQAWIVNDVSVGQNSQQPPTVFLPVTSGPQTLAVTSSRSMVSMENQADSSDLRWNCPVGRCDKDYATRSGLKAHVKGKHLAEYEGGVESKPIEWGECRY